MLGYENYNAVLPPYTRNFMPSTPELSFTSLDEFINKHVVENCKANSSEEEPKGVRKNDDAPIIKEWVSDNEEDDVPKAVVNAVKGNNFNAVKASACWNWKPKTKVLDHVSKHNSASITLKRFDYVDVEGRHMKGNMSYLTDYKEINRGYVAFGGNPKGGKITFWSTAMAKTINGKAQIHAKIDGKKIIVNESSVRRDLRLAYEKGIDYLLKTTAWNEFSSTLTSALEKEGQKLEKRDRSRTYKLKRLYKVDLTARVESSRDKESLGEDASKQGRIKAIDADEDITLVNVQDDAEMFDVNAFRW
uniref:Uncharacterized protein n=1 Tax=Tanacetum cinerariifolium TaxID=118510 RepID=A0A699HG01_TANCI|nr:hypothetical protein [Tanacetum cinerariifolium]